MLRKCRYCLGDGIFISYNKMELNNNEQITRRILDTVVSYGIPFVAVNEVNFIRQDDYMSYAISQCVLEQEPFNKAGFVEKKQNNYLYTPREVRDLYSWHWVDVPNVEVDSPCNSELGRFIKTNVRINRKIKHLFTDYSIAVKNTWAIASECNFELEHIFAEIEEKVFLIKFNNNSSYWREKLGGSFIYGTSLLEVLIEYAKERFKCRYAARIISYGKNSAVGAVMKVGKTLGMGSDILLAVREHLPKTIDVTTDEVLANSSELRSMCQKTELKTLMESARVIQYLPLHFAVNQSAFMISKKPLQTCIPTRFYEGEDMVEWPISVLGEMHIKTMQLEDFLISS